MDARLRTRCDSDWLPVEPDGKVGLLAAACIALRFDASACTACHDTCPVDCIDIAPGRFHVSGQCIGCGHCAAVCPTGALGVKGFEDLAADRNDDAVAVECLKVPETAARAGSLRVPCLGSLSPSRWLTIVEKAGGRPVVAMDRGWCAECEVAVRKGREHPAAAALGRAAQLAAAVSPAGKRPLLLKAEPLPKHLMPTCIPGSAPEAPSRRGFLLRIRGEAKRAVGADQDAAIPLPRAIRAQYMPLPERERLLATLQRMAAKARQPMPAAAFNLIEIAKTCVDHGVCAGICPTQALVRYEEDDRAGVAFDAARCIACGSCVAACPERAVTLSAAGELLPAGSPVPLTSHRRNVCRECLQPYFGREGDGCCPACRKNRSLGASLFGRG